MPSFGYMLIWGLSWSQVFAEELIPKPPIEKKVTREESQNLENKTPINPEWKEWLNKYASSSPFLAERKGSPAGYSPTDQQIKEVLDGNPLVKFVSPLELDNKDLSEYNLTQSTTALRFETVDQIDMQLLEPNDSKKRLMNHLERFRSMRSHIQEMIGSRKPNELMMFMIGATHGHDLFYGFFLNPDRSIKDPLYKVHTDVYYAQAKAQVSSEFFTNQYYRLQKALRGTEIEKETIKNYGVINFTEPLARLFYYRSLSSQIVKIQDLVKARENNLGAIVFLDRHRLQSPGVFMELPEAGSLISMGINQVVLGVEALQYGRDYTLEDLKPYYFVNDKTYFVTEEDRQYYKKFRPEAFKMLQKGVIYDENWRALADKLRSYQGRGIRILVTGVEDTDRVNKGNSSSSSDSTSSQN